MRHVWNAEGVIAFDSPVDDVDRVTAEGHIDQLSTWALPVLQLVLAHHFNEIVLLARTEPSETAVDTADRERECAGRRPPHEVTSLDWLIASSPFVQDRRHFRRRDADPRAEQREL